MKGLKRLLLVCMLMICVVFSLTACDKSSNTNDIKVGNEVHAEESAPPIEYWLEREGLTPNKVLEPGEFFIKSPTLKASRVRFEFSFRTSSLRDRKLNKLTIIRLKPFFILQETGSSGHWVNQTLDLDIFKYKNGVCEKKETHKESTKATQKNRHPKIRFDCPNEPGLWIYHIKEAYATIYFGLHGEYPEQVMILKDKVFAVQIGNDDFCDNFEG